LGGTGVIDRQVLAEDMHTFIIPLGVGVGIAAVWAHVSEPMPIRMATPRRAIFLIYFLPCFGFDVTSKERN
jgi:hypothetical protein